MGVRNSIFPPWKSSLRHYSSPKKKINPFEKCTYPGQKNRFSIFPPKKVPVNFIAPRQKFPFFIFHHSPSAPDENENTRLCKNEWVLEINVMWIGFYYSASCHSLTGAETGWRRLNPYRKKKEKRNERNNEENLPRSFFIVTGQEKVPQNAYRSRFVHSALPDSSLACKRDGGQRWENFVNWLSGYKISIVYEWRFALT